MTLKSTGEIVRTPVFPKRRGHTTRVYIVYPEISLQLNHWSNTHLSRFLQVWDPRPVRNPDLQQRLDHLLSRHRPSGPEGRNLRHE